MKTKTRALIAALLLIVAAAAGLYYLVTFRRYDVGFRDIEFTFLFSDAATGKPVPDATIDMRVEDMWQEPVKREAITLVADASGRAILLRKNQMVEDVVRPFRKTVTFVNLHWCVFTVTAPRYTSLEHSFLADFRYDDKGYFPEEKLHRIEFKMLLNKKT